jgi:predicted nucleic acid-binding protein
MISAVLDANVLYSASLRDFFLRLAEDDLLEPFWTEAIHDEWISSLLKNRADLKPESLARTRRIMDSHFPNALVRGFESIIPTLQLPDLKDRHILAAAMHAQAKYIVTSNIRDFPNAVLSSHQVEAISPDDFTLRVINDDIQPFITAVAAHRNSLTRPPKTVEQYIETLEEQKLHKTVEFLRQHKDKI